MFGRNEWKYKTKNQIIMTEIDGITATQEATSNYTSGIITANFEVNQAIPTNPVIINSTISSCSVLQLSNMSMLKRYTHGLKKRMCIQFKCSNMCCF